MKSEVAELIANNVIQAKREQIVMLGQELEFASGVRAAAAEVAIRERGVSDADHLLEVCDELAGQENLFESYVPYRDSSNTEPGQFVLGQGCPFASLEAYLELYELFGYDWLAVAAAEYAERWGGMALRKDPGRSAELVAKAREALAKVKSQDFKRFLPDRRTLDLQETCL